MRTSSILVEALEEYELTVLISERITNSLKTLEWLKQLNMKIYRRIPTKYHELLGQLLRFGVSTGFSSACSVLLPIGLHEGLGMNEKLAVAIGFLTAYVGNMLLIRVFVFRSTNNLKQDIPRYIIINGIFRIAEYVAFLILIAWTPLIYIAALLIVLSVSAILKFYGYRRLFSQ